LPAKATLTAMVGQDKTKHGPKCWMCSIPEREEAAKLYLAGRSMASIERALVKLYPDVSTLARVSAHFRSRHHER